MKHQAEGVTELVVTGAGARTHGKKIPLCFSFFLSSLGEKCHVECLREEDTVPGESPP